MRMGHLLRIDDAEKHLRRRGWTVTPTGCWEISGYRMTTGYGELCIGLGSRSNKVRVGAHRLAYEAWIGSPAGFEVCHSCDNPPCINPEHLFLGTHADNLQDMRNKGRGSTPPLHLGETNVNAVLTALDIPTIRERIADGDRIKDIARDYKVHRTTISSIKAGQAWRHV